VSWEAAKPSQQTGAPLTAGQAVMGSIVELWVTREEEKESSNSLNNGLSPVER